ncbi:hypothetical protein D3C73_1473630 [compost metagenome]
MAILASVKKMLVSLSKGRIFETRNYFAIAFRLLGKTGEVRHTRKANKKASNKIFS